MSKGNSYWGTARGKIGDIVVSVNKGQRIEKKYQPQVANPRTSAQMKQRARFAAAVKFYKRAYANFFRFAYEDKKEKESDFNAYMRHNTNNRMSVLKKSQVDGTFPVVNNSVVLTAGSLATTRIIDSLGATPYLQLNSLSSEEQTIGNLSSCLIADYNLQAGDIITIVRVSTPVTSLSAANPSTYPTWSVKQFLVDANSAALLSDLSEHLQLVSGKGLAFTKEAYTQAVWNAICFSRKNSNKLLVSTSVLYPNNLAYQMYIAAAQKSWVDAALKTWNASGDAVLEGSLVSNNLTNVSITAVNSNSVPFLSSLNFDSDVSSIVTFEGTGLEALTISNFTFTGGTVSELVITSDTEASIKLTGNGSHATSWRLAYAGNLIASHTDVQATISSASPSVINSMSASQTADITVTGTNVDSLKASDITVNGDGVSVVKIAATSSTSAVVTITASAAVTAATLSYDGKAFFTIKEIVVGITSPTSVSLGTGNQDIELTGEGLSTLTQSSFTATGGISIVSYNASSDTAAVLRVNVSSSNRNGTLTMGDKWAPTISFNSDDGKGS